jgi:hypothetical protein
MSLRIRIAFGRRRAAENESAPPLPVIEEDAEASSRPKYPFFYVYNSQEQSLAQAAARNRDKPLVTPSHPTDVRETPCA